MTRQRIKQIKNIQAGLCMYCPEPRVNKNHCEKHRLIQVARSNARYRATHDVDATRLKRLESRYENFRSFADTTLIEINLLKKKMRNPKKELRTL